MKTVSIVLPVFNHADFLPATLASFRSQTRQADEIILIDDASTDDSLNIALAFAKTNSGVVVRSNRLNRGVNASAQEGLALARGDYILFAAADDLWFPEYLNSALAILKKNPRAGLCFFDPASFVEENGSRRVMPNALKLSDGPAYLSPEELVEICRQKRVIISGMCLLNRQAVLAEGGFDAALRWHGDFFLNFCVAFRQGACYVPGLHTCWRYQPQSHLSKGVRDTTAQRKVLSRLMELLYDQKHEDVREAFKRSGVLSLARGSWKEMISRGDWSGLHPTFLRKAITNDIAWGMPPFFQMVIRRRGRMAA